MCQFRERIHECLGVEINEKLNWEKRIETNII